MSTDTVDLGKRRFLTAATSAVGAVGAAFVAVPFVKSMSPSARAQAAGAPVEADISKMEPGQAGMDRSPHRRDAEHVENTGWHPSGSSVQ